MTKSYAVSLTDVQEAAKRISGHAHVTPVMTCGTLDDIASTGAATPRKLFFKCENLQKVGAFKFRGAYNAISQIPEDQRWKGVVTQSSGNHAQAVALTCKLLGIKATIVMPHTAPKAKVNGVIGYGGKVVHCEPTKESRDQTAQKIVDETGAIFIHPFENPHVMAGQGTLMLELLAQTQSLGTQLDAAIVPCGGGGMLSGTAVAGKGIQKDLKVFGAEPENVDDCKRSFKRGVKLLQHEASGKTIADGLMTVIGEPNWEVIRDNVDDVFSVTEEQIVEAMRLVWERMKVVIEPSAAVGVAVALFNEDFKKLEVENVGIVFTGGNLDLGVPLPWVSRL
ncbi:hypothetical protein HDU79_010845 [Rhizoclosmatium sp. JEL0117]|nr:hypothetical protein HDU79_010845 [Rhizoclosmatium sp. JEL0117]